MRKYFFIFSFTGLLMSATIIDGKAKAKDIREHIKNKVNERTSKSLQVPGLAVILVGDDPASQVYVKHKRNDCLEVGITSKAFDLPSNTSQDTLTSLINDLNNDSSIHGILVQLPLPKHLNSNEILECISPKKDVDGFHPFNVGRLAQRLPSLRPCTPAGIIELLVDLPIKLKGKHAVIVGASNIVGRPMGLELLLQGCTVTTCHRFTENLHSHIAQADIVVAAVGRAGIVKGEWIKKGAIVIDVGINRLDDGTLKGDVDFSSAASHASFITPVPGGVGPMTRAQLLRNTLQACEALDDLT
jgi:methylenetetrahydrofolate dehydrogenase (NADP+)/methenyltetrahydrofolate cyclohydrolase